MKGFRIIAIVCMAALVVSAAYGGGQQDQGKAASASNSAAWTPRKDFTIRVPFAAGGAFDTAARIVGQGLQKAYGKTVIVKNITGANGAVAAADLLSVPADPTDMMGGGIAMFTLTPLFDKKVSMKLEDYRIVSGMIAEDFILCVNPSKSGIKSWQELAEYGKTNRIICATNPPAGATHMLATALFGGAGINFDAMTDNGGNKNMLTLLAGESVCTIVTASVALQHVIGGAVIPILVFSNDPYKGYAGITVPTAKSLGYDIVFRSSNFLMARAAVPQEQVDEIYKTITAYYQTDEFKELAKKAGFVPDPSDGPAVRKTIEAAADLCKSIYDKFYAPKK